MSQFSGKSTTTSYVNPYIWEHALIIGYVVILLGYIRKCYVNRIHSNKAFFFAAHILLIMAFIRCLLGNYLPTYFMEYYSIGFPQGQCSVSSLIHNIWTIWIFSSIFVIIRYVSLLFKSFI